MVRLLNVGYRHPSGGGVDGVTLQINSGDFILLQGRTGAGKTTLLRLIMNELSPQSGEVFVNGLRSSAMSIAKLPHWRRCLGMVFQDFRILDDRSALDNVILAALCENRLKRSPRERALNAVARVGMAHKLHSRPSELSSGERQRIAIARAIVNEPFVLLADEPVSSLDGATAAEIVEVLRQVNRSGTAVMVVTHQPERFAGCATKVLIMERGQVAV